MIGLKIKIKTFSVENVGGTKKIDFMLTYQHQSRLPKDNFPNQALRNLR
jgi:hypothetical protein